MDPKRQFASPYNGMGNNPVNGVDPDGAWVKGAGLWNNVFKSDERIYSERYAEAWGANSDTEYFAYALDGNWGVGSKESIGVGKPDGGFKGWANFTTFTQVNKDGSLGGTFGGLEQSMFYDPFMASGAITPDYTLESFIVGGALFKPVAAAVSFGMLRTGIAVSSFSTKTGTALFWSGIGSRAASAYTTKHGLTTLAQTAGGRFLNSRFGKLAFKFVPDKWAYKYLWGPASRKFTQGVTGNAHFLSNGYRGALWRGVEYSGLRQSGINVIRVMR